MQSMTNFRLGLFQKLLNETSYCQTFRERRLSVKLASIILPGEDVMQTSNSVCVCSVIHVGPLFVSINIILKYPDVSWQIINSAQVNYSKI